LYALADRYLIQHVEITGVSAYAAKITQAVQPTDAISTGSDGWASAQENGENFTTQAATATDTPAVVLSDDWSYQSEGVSISIRKEVTGSGSDIATFFVADVVVADATQLQNAFASDSFGRNIAETTSNIAELNNAVFAINGDYYGFRTDGIIIRNGVIYRDVPSRTGLVFYRDGTMEIYNETETTA